MNSDKRRGDITDAGMILLLLAGVAFGAAAVGHSVGFDSGVRAHAEGRYVRGRVARRVQGCVREQEGDEAVNTIQLTRDEVERRGG